MTANEMMEAQEKREFIEVRAGYQCEYVDEEGTRCECKGTEIAHMIRSKANLLKYGPEIVHHPKLLRLACKKHSAYFNRGFRPAVVKEMIALVEDEGIENWR